MKKLGIIGTGIAGMSAAYFLKDHYDITIFEKNNYVGGHTNTIQVNDGLKDCPTDTGFMVFNEKTYPNLVKLFTKLKVPIKDSDMSFSVRNEKINLEYNGSNLNGIFAQRKNLINLKFIKMLRDIHKFNSHAEKMLSGNQFDGHTIQEYTSDLQLGDYFFNNYLVPMSSAVWSTPMEKIKDFPAKSLVRFFHNHGFLGLNTQLQWKTVEGGSINYRDLLIDPFKERIKTHQPVLNVKQHENQIEVRTSDHSHHFDKVIVATHADEALNLIENPSREQKEILSKFSYSKNQAVVHTDETVMPNLRKNWSSWNFLIKNNKSYTVYYMNRLQGVSEKKNFFVNINGEEFVNEKKIIKEITYHHPVFDFSSIKTQEKIDGLNSNTNLHFTGSYYRYGFHEDALLSSVNLCSSILKRGVLL